MELLSAPGLTEDADKRLREFLAELDVAEISTPVEEATVRLRKYARLGLPDAIIAGTAEVLECPLVTADQELVRKLASRLQVVDPYASVAPGSPPAAQGEDESGGETATT